jgi:2-dehydro-3-deoxygluconokinase
MARPATPPSFAPTNGRANTFVSIGECMVEMSPATKADEFRRGFAGDTFNTTWYVKALAPHWQTRFVSRVGTDEMSDQMMAMMVQSGIETCHGLPSDTR